MSAADFCCPVGTCPLLPLSASLTSPVSFPQPFFTCPAHAVQRCLGKDRQKPLAVHFFHLCQVAPPSWKRGLLWAPKLCSTILSVFTSFPHSLTLPPGVVFPSTSFQVYLHLIGARQHNERMSYFPQERVSLTAGPTEMERYLADTQQSRFCVLSPFCLIE